MATVTEVYVKKVTRGFTLIELLVVVAIIGILSSIVFSALNNSRTHAKVKTTQTQLREIEKALTLLEIDTGRTAGGCPPGTLGGTSNEFSLNDSRTGLVARPTDFNLYDSCQWTPEAVLKWRGPYIETPKDVWGNELWYDSDYHPLLNASGACADTYSGDPVYAVVVSGGPNGISGGWSSGGSYDCDDIFLILQ